MIILELTRKPFRKSSKNDSQNLKRRPILIGRPISSPESITTYLFVTIDDIYDQVSSTETSFLGKKFLTLSWSHTRKSQTDGSNRRIVRFLKKRQVQKSKQKYCSRL